MTKVFLPGRIPNTVCTLTGEIHVIPDDWSLLPPGDAGLTRRVKQAGPHWVLEEKRGHRRISLGLYAPTATIERIRVALQAERKTESYQKRARAAIERRERAQVEYVGTFTEAILRFLAFHPTHADLAQRLAEAVAAHATPVGSGTIARRPNIPLANRVEAAVIAWLRHQTTNYDNLSIPRVKGKRREIRKLLAQRSWALIQHYRTRPESIVDCPLQRVLVPDPQRAVA